MKCDGVVAPLLPRHFARGYDYGGNINRDFHSRLRKDRHDYVEQQHC